MQEKNNYCSRNYAQIAKRTKDKFKKKNDNLCEFQSKNVISNMGKKSKKACQGISPGQPSSKFPAKIRGNRSEEFPQGTETCKLKKKLPQTAPGKFPGAVGIKISKIESSHHGEIPWHVFFS